jgi:UMF1 family MFS transporter
VASGRGSSGLTSKRLTSADARAMWSWAFFDFANSPFSTLVVTFIYAAYFTQAIAPDPISGTALWSRGVTATALVVAFASPMLGAFADRGGYRKPFLLLFTTVAIAGCIALYTVLPGQVALALVIFVVANICFELASVHRSLEDRLQHPPAAHDADRS